MPTEKPEPGQSRGGTRMRERGMKQVQVWLDPREAALLQTVAGRLRMPLATYIRQEAFRAAERAAEEHRKRSTRERNADQRSTQ